MLFVGKRLWQLCLVAPIDKDADDHDTADELRKPLEAGELFIKGPSKL